MSDAIYAHKLMLGFIPSSYVDYAIRNKGKWQTWRIDNGDTNIIGSHLQSKHKKKWQNVIIAKELKGQKRYRHGNDHDNSDTDDEEVP